VDYEGEIFQVRNYKTPWAKSQPPRVHIGANGPKMIEMAAKYAKQMMLSDKTVQQVAEAKQRITETRLAAGLPAEPFRLNNFWAWHVKEEREETVREARVWLALRGVLLRKNHVYFMSPEDCDIVHEARPRFFEALARRSPDIKDVPERIINLLIENLTSCASVDNLDKEIDRLKAFEKAGQTEIALRIYEKPEETIRVLGERVIPALV
jgi:5,10-methylenetetrahydromethanopterin reductase